MKPRAWLARHALGLWFLGIAALGVIRWWMKVGREASSAQAPDARLWLAGSITMAGVTAVSTEPAALVVVLLVAVALGKSAAAAASSLGTARSTRETCTVNWAEIP